MTRAAGPLSRTCASAASETTSARSVAAPRSAAAAREVMCSIVLLRRASGDRLVAATPRAALRHEWILEILHVEALVGKEALRVLEARRDLGRRRVDAPDRRHRAHPRRHRGGVDRSLAVEAREHLLDLLREDEIEEIARGRRVSPAPHHRRGVSLDQPADAAFLLVQP